MSDEMSSAFSEEDLMYYKNAMRRKRIKAVIIAAVATLVICCVCVVAAYVHSDDVPVAPGVTDSADVTVDSETPVQSDSVESVEGNINTVQQLSGFPYTVQDGEIITVRPFGKNIAVLSDGFLRLLNKKGSVVLSLPHSYADPVIKTGAERGMIFDKLSGNYRVFNSSREVFSGNAGGEIITCDIGKNNRYAIAKFNEESVCVLSLMYADGSKEVFEWLCPTERIVSVSVSPNGEKVAAAVLSSQQGQLLSKVYVFDVHMTETPEPFVCGAGEAVISVDFISNNSACVVTDGSRTVISLESNAIGYSMTYDSSLLQYINSDDKGNTAVSLLTFGQIDSSTVFMYDKDNAEAYNQIVTTASADAVACYNGNLSILYGDRVETYNKRGEKISEGFVPQTCNRLVASKSGVYAYSPNAVYFVS